MDKTLAALYALDGLKQSSKKKFENNSSRQEKMMLNQINYELAKYDSNERLKKAEHDHLIRVAKVASKTKPKRRWSLKLFSR